VFYCPFFTLRVFKDCEKKGHDFIGNSACNGCGYQCDLWFDCENNKHYFNTADGPEPTPPGQCHLCSMIKDSSIHRSFVPRYAPPVEDDYDNLTDDPNLSRDDSGPDSPPAKNRLAKKLEEAKAAAATPQKPKPAKKKVAKKLEFPETPAKVRNLSKSY
jgi:hypothetical protein